MHCHLSWLHLIHLPGSVTTLRYRKEKSESSAIENTELSLVRNRRVLLQNTAICKTAAIRAGRQLEYYGFHSNITKKKYSLLQL